MLRFLRVFIGVSLCSLALPLYADENTSAKTFRLASWGPPQHFSSQSRRAWVKAVNERSGGRIEIIEYPSGQLYGPKNMHRAIARGLVDIGVILQPRLMATVPLLQGVYLPFAFDTLEQAAAAYSGESLEVITQAMQEKNLQLVYPTFAGSVNIFSSQGTINTVEDMQNLRVLATSPMFTEILHKLHAAPDTSIPQSEQYMALKRGVADALLNGIVTGYFQRNHEVAPYVTMANMSFPSILLTVNLDVWNALPEDIQAIMIEEGEKQKAYTLSAANKMEAHFKQVIAENGGKIETMPEQTRREIQQLSQQVWRDWASRNGPKAERLLELNLALQNDKSAE
ncbi:TRAP transporter substrate-binding protein [Aestuariibacter salexigens]|uniref:TRAP transporter substrate-binding protein n=1 Tax=Aestuariibacter salexigens TaxID=226010 RepID=UPI0003FC4276|nr:TRAP transporter substrate-binding protein DctP [Aestuariibacter salexigens]